MRVQSVLVLLLPCYVITLCHYLARVAHVVILESAPQAVVNHRINQHAVSKTITFARLRNQIRRVRHRLHPTRNDYLRITKLDSLCCHHHGLQTRAADFVDRDGWNAERNPTAKRCLPSRILPKPCLNDAAHDHFINIFRLHARTPHTLAHNHRSQIRRLKIFQRALKFSRRRSHCADDDGLSSIWHLSTSINLFLTCPRHDSNVRPFA